MMRLNSAAVSARPRLVTRLADPRPGAWRMPWLRADIAARSARRTALQCAVPLLMVGLVAGAQADPTNPCNAPMDARPAIYSDLTAPGSIYECAPKPLGRGTLPTLRNNRAGMVAWWYCPRHDGRWSLNWAAVTNARLDASALLHEIVAVVSAPDPKAAFDAIAAKNVRLPLSDPALAAVWCPFADEMHSSAPPSANALDTRDAGPTPSSADSAASAHPPAPVGAELPPHRP